MQTQKHQFKSPEIMQNPQAAAAWMSVIQGAYRKVESKDKSSPETPESPLDIVEKQTQNKVEGKDQQLSLPITHSYIRTHPYT